MSIRQVSDALRDFDVSQRFASRTTKTTSTRHELHDPFYRIGIDIVGPLPKTSRKNKYIVAATDHLTRWTETRAIREKITKNVAIFIF